MAATPQEIKKYEAKGREQVDEGLPGWFGTFADMMTLLFAFFVLLAAISTIDPVKLQNMADGMGKSVGKKEELDNQAMSLGDIHKAATKMVEEMAEDSENGETPVEVTTSPKGVTLYIANHFIKLMKFLFKEILPIFLWIFLIFMSFGAKILSVHTTPVAFSFPKGTSTISPGVNFSFFVSYVNEKLNILGSSTCAFIF